MRSFTLNGNITAKRIKELIRKIEICDSKNVNVYLCSDGGESWMAYIFIDFSYRTNKKLHFIGVGKLISACMDIFIKAKGKKSLHPYTVGLLHFATYAHESRELLNKKGYEIILQKEIKKDNEEYLILQTKLFDLIPKEISLLKNGGDLGISYDRFKKALPKINKLKLCRNK